MRRTRVDDEKICGKPGNWDLERGDPCKIEVRKVSLDGDLMVPTGGVLRGMQINSIVQIIHKEHYRSMSAEVVNLDGASCCFYP